MLSLNLSHKIQHYLYLYVFLHRAGISHCCSGYQCVYKSVLCYIMLNSQCYVSTAMLQLKIVQIAPLNFVISPEINRDISFLTLACAKLTLTLIAI